MNAIELYNKACERLDSGATLAELSDAEYRVFMITHVVNCVVNFAERLKMRPLDVADNLSDTIEDLLESGKIKANYGKPADEDDDEDADDADDADDDFPLF